MLRQPARGRACAIWRAARARVCAALGIGRELSGVDLCTASRVVARARMRGQRGVDPGHARASACRAISIAGLRFIERGSAFVSVPP